MCTTDSCDAVLGVSHIAINVDDGIACTVDSCDAITGPSHVANNTLCDNGQYCDGIEVCNVSVGCEAGTVISCVDVDGLSCTTDACIESIDEC